MRTAMLGVVGLTMGLMAGLGVGEDPPWPEILGPVSEGEMPAAEPPVIWRTDLRSSLAEARASNRPLFVTWRCLPCKQCAEFDKDVLEGGGELTPLLERFVTVRMTNAASLDFDIFRPSEFQDFDVSWWGYFLSPAGEIYGVFGGRDHVSDTTRISQAALINAMQRVLEHHADPRRTTWSVDGDAPLLGNAKTLPRDLPGYASWERRTPAKERAECIHCHFVGDIVRQPAIDAGTFDKTHDVDIWPYPENVGVTVDRDHGLLVTAVTPDSPAARIGLRVGDELGSAGGRRLFSQTDFRAVLHREAKPSGEIDVWWVRDGQPMHGRLVLASGWRDTVLDWRMTISQGNVGAAPGFGFPLRGPQRPTGGLSIKPYFGQGDASRWASVRAGLSGRHIIIAVDGESPALHGRAFLTWFRLRYDPGDEVTLTVLDGDVEREITYTLE